MKLFNKSLFLSACAAALLATLPVDSRALQTQPKIETTHIKHVLLISVDGLHALDLLNFSAAHPHSAMAALARSGIEYTEAHTVGPADSFPGLMALITGGTPAVTGVYYDVSYDRRLSSPGSNCSQPGALVIYDESVDAPGIADGKPLLKESLLPLDAKSCKPVYPHSYLRVNTVFEVVREAGGHTAWIDKHPVYEIANGPSGRGVEDLYTPEIGANPDAGEGRYSDRITASIAGTERYDLSKVNALIDQIHGFRHDGKTAAAVPTLFGLNLQTVSVAQKLAGYQDGQGHPVPQLESALVYSDTLIGKIVAALRERKLLDSTLLVVTAKHGNGPIDPRVLRHVDEEVLSRTIEQAAPGALAQIAPDHGVLIWLRDQSKTAQVAKALLHRSDRLGIGSVMYGASLRLQFPSPLKDARTPDLIVMPQQGVIYAKAGDMKKAEHGGFGDDDTHVALLISNPALQHIGELNRTPVFTTQVAPTMLASLGLAPMMLEAVARQGTAVLPGENWQAIAGKLPGSD
jgi:hypothetical protein